MICCAVTIVPLGLKYVPIIPSTVFTRTGWVLIRSNPEQRFKLTITNLSLQIVDLFLNLEK